MVLGLYLLSFLGTERGRVMRASYLPVRFVDDLLDGDVKGFDDPLIYSRNLKEQIVSNSFDESGIGQMLSYAISVLEQKAKPTDNPRYDFIRAINAIEFDHLRAKERRVLSAEEIELYYREAFDPVIDITLLAIDSHLRSSDIPALSFGQGRVYSARDFATDWGRGIINVPGEILNAAGTGVTLPFKQVENNRLVRAWFLDILQQTKTDLLGTRMVLRKSNERQTELVCNSLISPMLRFIDQYP